MSWYTTTGVTVSAEKAEAFLKAIREDEEHAEDFTSPSRAVRHSDGSITLVYGWQNHFPCDELVDLLDEHVGPKDYAMTVADETNGIEEYGGGQTCHETQISISIWADGNDFDVTKEE